MAETEPVVTQPKDFVELPPEAPWYLKWMVAEWRSFWSWATTYLLGAAMALPSAYESIPGLKDSIPAAWLHWVQTALAVITFVNLLRKKS